MEISLPDPFVPSKGDEMYEQALGITNRQARDLINAGRLNGTRLGRIYLVTPGEFIRSMQDGVRPPHAVAAQRPTDIIRTKRTA